MLLKNLSYQKYIAFSKTLLRNQNDLFEFSWHHTNFKVHSFLIMANYLFLEIKNMTLSTETVAMFYLNNRMSFS